LPKEKLVGTGEPIVPQRGNLSQPRPSETSAWVRLQEIAREPQRGAIAFPRATLRLPWADLGCPFRAQMDASIVEGLARLSLRPVAGENYNPARIFTN
jgi:hypothetical protein